MVKVQNSIATREPLPSFLVGLAPESLADLSWTDPALGVSDAAWWEEDNQTPQLGEFEKYGEETLTLDTVNKKVIVTREVLPMMQQEIDEIVAQKAAQKQARIDEIKQQIAALQEELAALE